MQMRALGTAALVLVLFSGCSAGTGLGSDAPELKGAKWITSDGYDPLVTGKVRVVDFWFAT